MKGREGEITLRYIGPSAMNQKRVNAMSPEEMVAKPAVFMTMQELQELEKAEAKENS